MNEQTPVEALQAEIDRVGRLLEVNKRIAWPDGVATTTWNKYLAALELAKADAEWHDHAKLEPKCSGIEWSDWAVEQNFLQSIVHAARTKFYEALKS